MDAACAKQKADATVVIDVLGCASWSAHVVARESAHVEAWGSAHVVARGSAHVEAWESAHVEARESAHVEASAQVAIHIHATTPTVIGGVQIRIARPTTVEEWRDYYGIVVSDGNFTAYKAVRDDLRSQKGFLYALGTTVEAPDWHAEIECGNGLHFIPRPIMGLEFDRKATRFLACRVEVAACRAPRADDDYPHKIKARGCAVLHEVTRWGEAIAPTAMEEPAC